MQKGGCWCRKVVTAAERWLLGARPGVLVQECSCCSRKEPLAQEGSRCCVKVVAAAGKDFVVLSQKLLGLTFGIRPEKSC